MSTDTEFKNINEYLKQSGQDIKHLMPGTNFFGFEKVEEIAREAISREANIEFYYKTDNDLRADKLSYKFTPRKTL